ncbi:hypothetical protein H0H93_012076, partial [Arthromyces matolae]
TELRDDLGFWLCRRRTKGVQAQGTKARQIVNLCGVPETVLRSEWESQRSSELSIRAHAPLRLKKELDAVLALQGDLEASEKNLQTARVALSKAKPAKKSLKILANLQDHHEQLKDDLHKLYSSLTVLESFPELSGVDLEFVKLLLIARDLKINVRKRAIGSFFRVGASRSGVRWPRPSVGTDYVIGTKLHQATRSAIKKRTPALMAGLQKYNDICATLAATHKPEWQIPLPEPLPTDLKQLREAPSLMEDVWISRPSENVPRWLSDSKVREGIRALLKVDRCKEESARLHLEATNLAQWFNEELAAIELALDTHHGVVDTFYHVFKRYSLKAVDSLLRVPLHQQKVSLINLRSLWSGPATHWLSFNTLVSQASSVTSGIAGPLHPASSSSPIPIHVQTAAIYDDEHNDESDDEHDDEASDRENDGPSAEEILFEDYLAQNVEGEVEVESFAPQMDVQIIWETPSIAFHTHLLDDLAFQTFGNFAPLSQPRYFPHGRGRFVFSLRELEMMRLPNARLNDVCINGIAALFTHQFLHPSHPASLTSARCAIFTTYDLLMIRHNASDAEMWRRTRHTQYWNRDIWILPIHRSTQEHWVMCTILPSEGLIHLFDSLALCEPWGCEVKEIMTFVTRLVSLSNKNGHALSTITSGWAALPTIISPCQTNGYDCGIWVLANIAAVLSGYQATGVLESDISYVRQSLLYTLLALPVAK